MNKIQSLFGKISEVLAAKHHFMYVLSEGCCSIEIENAGFSTYDWQRIGVDDVGLRPEVCDLLMVAGWVNETRVQQIKNIYSVMKKPSGVIAVGACALSGSPYDSELQSTGVSSPAVIKVSDIVPVDVFVSGCPPRPELLIDGILEYQKKLTPGPHQEKVLQSAFRPRHADF